MCVGVTLWFGWGGVVSVCRLKQCRHQVGLSLFNYQDDARSNKQKGAKMLRMKSHVKVPHGALKILPSAPYVVPRFVG